jgi:creatinine amidohydrolase
MKNKTKYPDYMWATLSWPEIKERLTEVDTAILPCGAIEQHGPHLPLDIDFFDADYLARKVAENFLYCRPSPTVYPTITVNFPERWLSPTMPCLH